MSDRIFGWDLPPGVSPSDIPGNRPEDAKWEEMEDNFYDKERLMNPKYGLRVSEKEYALMSELFESTKYSDVVSLYISCAIEYGTDIGSKQERDNNEQNRFYETSLILEALKQASINAEVIQKVKKLLKGDYETP